jgi:hypothetical protein
MIITSIIDIYKKIVKWDKKLDIYTNGADNAYPERMERFRNNSITATMSSNTMIQYLLGKGFGEADNLKIGNIKLIDLADDIAHDLVDNRGCFVHVNYDANYDISDFKVLPFSQCRIGEKDSADYNGKILIYKDWSEKIEKSKLQILNVYNPKKEIVQYQAEKSGGIENYKGQVFYYNMDNQYYYPLARIDAVSFECDNEYQASLYKNEILRRGFFGKTLVITRPLIDAGFIDTTLASGNSQQIAKLRQQESEVEAFKKGLSDFIGVGNIGGVMHMQVDFAGEKLDDAILFKNIESNINPDLFKFTEDSAVSKILMAFNNLPIGLIKSDNSLFGTGGEALKVMKETYWESTWKERNLLETILNDFLKNMGNPSYTYVSIMPLLTKEVDTDSATAEKQKAQAQLKGSVGGVQGVLAIQASVSQGLTDYESAITILNEIFGIEDTLARSILGNPKTV